MSKLERLQILGVRSFDNARVEAIVFNTPLTLIVGSNGSGKTTIIECLKYATTGELPPNSKGGAFIHDPLLCGEKEVMAQVKMQFRSAEGMKMVVTRSLQLTVKKASRSQKTLEANLRLTRDGEHHSMSSRVAEIDGMMPYYLGVSKAILDSVIFCHQDESLWPLSEPSALKKRFDEIFEALKYTKAIDNIKVMAKQQKIHLALFQKEEENTKVNKDRADKMEKQMRKLDAEIAKLRESSEELSVKIKEAAQHAESAWNKAETAGMTVGNLMGKRIERNSKEESVKSLQQTLTVMSESDQELADMVEQYEERVSASKQGLEKKKESYGQIGAEIGEGRSRVSAKERELGSYQAQEENNARQISTREKIVKETARSHGIRGFDLDINDDRVREFMERIARMARDQNAELERTRRATQEELRDLQKVVNRHNEQKSSLNQNKESSRQSIAGWDRRIAVLQAKSNAINVDEGGNAAMASNLQNVETRLDTAKTNFTSDNWEEQMATGESKVREHEDRKDKLGSELVEATRRASDSAQLDYLQKEFKDRQRSLETMEGAHGEKISSLIGQAWTPATIEAEYGRVVSGKSSQLEEARNQKEGTEREMDGLNAKLQACRDNQMSKKAVMTAAARAISKALNCPPEDYPVRVSELNDERDVAKSDLDSLKFINDYFDSCIKVATRSGGGCKTCNRQFSEDKSKKSREVEMLKQTIAVTRKTFEEVEKSADDFAEIEKDLESARALSADFEAWERLKEKEIPALEREVETLEREKEELNQYTEKHDSRLSDCMSAKRDVDSIARTVQNIAKYSTDIASFQTQIKELSQLQKLAGLSRGLEMIQEDIRKVNEETRTAKTHLAKIIVDRDRDRSTINTLELEKRDINLKLSTAQSQLNEKKSLESGIEELKGYWSDEREKIKAFDADLQKIGPQLSQAQVKYDDCARSGAEEDREQQAKTTKLNNSENQVKLADQEIQSYLDRGGPEQLKRGKRELQNLKDEVTRTEKEQQILIRDINVLNEQLRNHDETKKSIIENQRYRNDLRQLQKVRAVIEELETHNAEEDKVHYEREGSRFQQQRNKFAGEQATIIGSLKSKDETLNQSIKDWETDYSEAAKKYKEATIKVMTCKACIEDLGRYGGALDKAIMKYHSLKMEEINRIVAELWRSTYQGTDVDTILIRSESENVKANKSYNYRVCMVKQDAEMDMRGRCSAGQKVLACIIIRLALAECFGVNCGMIALDEPTTNLDSENIRALAQSLSEIIRVRRAQKNFQLIVITHDEEFLRSMNCSDYTDNYWRVSRNQSQKSQIKKSDIAEML